MLQPRCRGEEEKNLKKKKKKRERHTVALENACTTLQTMKYNYMNAQNGETHYTRMYTIHSSTHHIPLTICRHITCAQNHRTKCPFFLSQLLVYSATSSCIVLLCGTFSKVGFTEHETSKWPFCSVTEILNYFYVLIWLKPAILGPTRPDY